MIHRRPVDRSIFPSSIVGGTDINLAEQALRPQPQYAKDVSHDSRKDFSSLFGYAKRAAERDAFQQACMTPSGTPGVLNIGILDADAKPIPFTPFEWNGRQLVTDAKGMVRYVERDYFQTAISMENERAKYVNKMISLVFRQPAENVISLFGFPFYEALAGDETGPGGSQAAKSQQLYKSYLATAGIPDRVVKQKMFVFRRYSDAEASPEVMTNYGDNDPDSSKAFDKLALLVEYHPSAIIFDKATLDPLESSGTVHGDSGHSNPGPPDTFATARIAKRRKDGEEKLYPDPNDARRIPRYAITEDGEY